MTANLYEEIADLNARLEAYRVALTPQEWTIAHSVAWKNNSDTPAAFAALRAVAEAAPQQEQEGEGRE